MLSSIAFMRSKADYDPGLEWHFRVQYPNLFRKWRGELAPDHHHLHFLDHVGLFFWHRSTVDTRLARRYHYNLKPAVW